MKFDSHEDFKVYSNHPLHNEFVEKRFKLEVEDFLEADFESL